MVSMHSIPGLDIQRTVKLIGCALGRGDNIPGVERTMGRANAMQNYIQNNTVNGGLTNGFTQPKMEDTNGNGVLEKPPGL
jgi:hypothetical protein